MFFHSKSEHFSSRIQHKKRDEKLKLPFFMLLKVSGKKDNSSRIQISDPEKMHPGSGSWFQGVKKHKISDVMNRTVHMYSTPEVAGELGAYCDRHNERYTSYSIRCCDEPIARICIL
jgi:hypothetical protein